MEGEGRTAGKAGGNAADEVVRRSATRRADRRPRQRKLLDWWNGRRSPVKPVLHTPLCTPGVKEKIGICCSGGGIRSAAYNLGALQVLREEGILDEAAYVSAVSGGAYIAGSFAAVATASPPSLLGPDTPPVYAPGSPEERHLRNNSTYMAPGAGGKLRLLTRLLLGMLVHFLLIGAVLFLLAQPLGWAYGGFYSQLASESGRGTLDLAWWMLVPALTAAIAGAAIAAWDLVFRSSSGKGLASRERWSRRWLVISVMLAVLFLLLPQAILTARTLGASETAQTAIATTLPTAGGAGAGGDAADLFKLLGGGALLTSALGALAGFAMRRRRIVILAAGAIAGPIAVLAFWLLIVNAGALDGPTATGLERFGIALFAVLLAWQAVDLTQWSLHPFYRRQLSSAFFVRRTGRARPDKLSVEEIPFEKPPRLSRLRAGAAGGFPELIVGAAANVSDHGQCPPGRAATPFAFSADHIGGPLVGTLDTADYESQADEAARDITLPAAVAVSGAAVSPMMGKKTIRALTFLMALTNVRLGVWIPNPRRAALAARPRFQAVTRVARNTSDFVLPGESRPRAASTPPSDASRSTRAMRWILRRWRTAGQILGRRRPSPLYVFKELLGRTSLDDPFVYVTDGGHYDNLGLIELLRRGCTTIFCFDAGGDPSGTYRALGEAVALARIDLQVDVEVDPEPSIPSKKSRLAEQDHVIGAFRYRVAPSGMPIDVSGRLVYCRATVTKDAPWDVRAYHEKTKRFPNHSTFDQLFDDQRFEAYRALGAHTARSAAATYRTGLTRPAQPAATGSGATSESSPT